MNSVESLASSIVSRICIFCFMTLIVVIFPSLVCAVTLTPDCPRGVPAFFLLLLLLFIAFAVMSVTDVNFGGLN